MITLIGTGHVFNLSAALLKVFDEKNPDILCVELDRQRYHALVSKQADPKEYKKREKDLPIIYKLLARFQNNMANQYGVTAGQEMLTTINYAQTHQLPLAFIDMNAQLLFKRMLKKMTFSEKIKLMITGFAGFFISKKHVEKEISNLEENLDVYIQQMDDKFPTIKRVLIDERNLYMAQQLSTASEKYENVVAVMGDGHIPGISKLLDKKDLDYETVRLSQIRNQPVNNADSSSASFSLEYKSLN